MTFLVETTNFHLIYDLHKELQLCTSSMHFIPKRGARRGATGQGHCQCSADG